MPRKILAPGQQGRVGTGQAPSGAFYAHTLVGREGHPAVTVNARGATEHEARERLAIRVADLLAGRERTLFDTSRSPKLAPGQQSTVRISTLVSGAYKATTCVRPESGPSLLVRASALTEQEARERLAIRVSDVLAGREMTTFPRLPAGTSGRRVRRIQRGPQLLPEQQGPVNVSRTPYGTPQVRVRVELPDGEIIALTAAGKTEEEALDRLKRRIQQRLVDYDNGWRPMKRLPVPLGGHGVITVRKGTFRVSARANVRLTEDTVVIAQVSAPTEADARRDLAARIDDLLAGRAQA